MAERDNSIEKDLKLKFFREELSAEEQRALKEQLKASDDDRRLFNDMRFIFDATEAIHLGKSAHLSQAETKIKKKLVFSSYVAATKRFAMKIAAILVLPLVITTTLLYLELSKEKSVAYNDVSCLNGRVSLITLPDGSKVYLHSGSTLRYPNKFRNNERLVELHGEGFFEVESNKEKPFFVQVPDGSRVKAYGTAFNVSAYQTDNKVTVFLARGAVDFTSTRLSEAVVLKPGTELVYDKDAGTYEKTMKNTGEYTDWINGKLVFNKASMSEVVNKLSRHYNVDIEVKDERLNKYFFSATFKDENIYQVLNMLKKSSPRLIWEIEQPNDSTVEKQKISLTMIK